MKKTKSKTETASKPKRRRAKKDRQLQASFLLMVVLALVLAGFFFQYYRLERQGCATRLQEHTETAGHQVLQAVDRAKTYLNKVSDLIYDRCLESEERGTQLLSTLSDISMLSRLELVLPDGTMYTAHGIQHDPTLSYDKLAAEGTGVTRRSLDQLAPDQQIVRLFVPVRRNDQTVAMLCGVLRSDRLEKAFPVNAYDGKAKLYLMESETGNYLIDPDHEKPGNLRDMESYLFTRGYSKEQFFREARTGHGGVTITRSSSSNSNDYLCYAPVGFDDWMVMLSVDEDLAFAQSTTVFWLFILLIALVVTSFSIFLFWFFRDVRRRQARTNLQLQGERYMLDVQQALFQAHVDPGAFERALWIIVNYLTADAVAYYGLTGDDALLLQSLSGSATKVPPRRANLQSFFPQITETVLTDGQFFSSRPFLWKDEDRRAAQEMGIRGLMAVRLDALGGKKPMGVLVAVNPDILWVDTEPLEQVAMIFSMAAENRQNYQTLSYISQVDDLTGLMNRTSYHARLDELSEMEGGMVGCVYIDVNGLHEINNHLGHDAGDEMLRSVADALLASFNKKDVFRLGGDEFAVLVTAMPQEELDRKARKMEEAVEKCGYTVSVGVECRRGEFQIQSVVAAAEAAMRKAKAEFYAHKGGERQMRNLNTRLEQTLSAKRDADTLLSYLVPHLRGVYFVDPQKDSCRSIVALPNFEAQLKEAEYSFRGAMTLYVQSHVHPDDRQRLLACCQYDAVLPLLEKQGSLDLQFRRIDGDPTLLQIRYPRRAGDKQGELIWFFANASPTPSEARTRATDPKTDPETETKAPDPS